MQLKLQNLSCISLFLLLTFSPNSAELSRQASRLAENLGLLLGLPLDVDIPRANASAVPRFLMDVYNCWTSLGATRDRSSCLPVSGRTSKNLNDVNVVRGMKGSAAQSTTEAVFSHSPHQSPLPPSLSLHFNVSMRRVKEDIRYVYTRIPKQALSEKELESVKEQCTGPVSLQLLVKINSSQVGSSLDAFSLLSTARLQPGEIGRKQQVEFSGVTEEFRQWQKEDAESTRQGDMVEMRLIIGGNGESCYDELTPQHLGFRPNTNSYIVVFSKSDDSEEAIIKAGLAELAAEATASRQRRSDETTTDATVTEETGSENGTRPFNISSYHLSSCRRYSHTVRMVPSYLAKREVLTFPTYNNMAC
jgi:hypothetical protein